MLRNRSRAVTSKQALMADHTPSSSSLSPTKNPSSPISSFLNSPRFFNGHLKKNNLFSETESNSVVVMSPTSILDIKSPSSFVNPFGYDKIVSKYEINSPPKQDTTTTTTKAIGLALIDSIIDEKKSDQNFSKPINRTSLYGSKLKVQIPVITNPTTTTSSSISPNESPKSPADFGIKTKNNSQFLNPFSNSPVKDFTRQLSLKEMELSEDYTCVITHGPNPKTTHIFDDCVVGRCLGDDHIKNCGNKRMECVGFVETNGSNSPSTNFLSFCHTCKDVLGQGKDIYIYRGEKAFCSNECRCEEMFSDGMKNQEMDDAF